MAGLALLLAATEGMSGVVGSPHDFSQSGPWTQSPDVAPSGTCSACHVPHGAQVPYLWVRDLSGYSNPSGTGKLDIRDGSPSSEPNFLAPVTVACYDCHDYHNTQQFESPNAPALSLFNSNHKPQDILFGFTKISTGSMTEYNAGPQSGKTTPGFFETNPPGSPGNFGVNLSAPLAQTGGHYFQQDPTGTSGDRLDIGGKLPCTDCHDPHAWNSNWQAFIRPYWPTGTVPSRLLSTVEASTYMANDSTPTNRRSDVNSRNICIACHGNSDTLQPVFFNEIQATYRSDARIVRPPTLIGEHASSSQVACVSCHAHNSVGASCTSCHGFPPSETASPAYPVTATSTFVPAPPPGSNDSHPRHYGRGSGSRASVYEFGCDVCHYFSSGIGVATQNMHQDTLVSVVLQGAYSRNGGASDITNYYNPANSAFGQMDNTAGPNGWGAASPARSGGNSCRNVYCHSAGRDPASMGDNDYRVPRWNTGGLGCDQCHGPGTGGDAVQYGMPNYPNGGAGTPTANSHAAHVVNGPFECSLCHAGTVAGTGLSRSILGTRPSLHVNRARDVQFGGGASGSYNASAKSCSVSCHGADTPVWGGTLANGCFSCHVGTEQAYKPQNDYGIAGTPNPVDNAEYLHSGHGRSGSNYPGSGNLPAAFSSFAATSAECYVCHSQAALHTTKSPNDPFRLGSSADGTLGGFGGAGGFTGAWADNTDLLCLGCHGTSAQRSGHDNAAKGTTTIDAQIHARGITGTKYAWPGPNYPWKCVDCHDPHGDGKGGADRYMMVRSGINAPTGSGDTAPGSDGKSRPRRTDANVLSVTFNSLSGYAAGSYAQPGTSTWGICEVCHTQTNAYSRTLDNTASHATRTNRCTTCHPHAKGFAPSACEGCHGGLDGLQAPSNNAPVVTRYWQSSGHGKFTTGAPARTIVCEDCHDTGYLTGSSHKTDGSVPGAPPLNINTENWPGKPVPTADTSPNANTSHLKAGFLNTAAATRADVARTFDNFCATAAGCHAKDYHRHQKSSGPAPTDVMRFGDPGTGSTADPKQYNWLPFAVYATDFYRSQSPWVDSDIRAAGLADNTNYGLCVSCHDPHGSATTDTKGGGTQATNAMVRWNWKTDAGTFCARACHTSRTPP